MGGDRRPVAEAVAEFEDEVMSQVRRYIGGFRDGYEEALEEVRKAPAQEKARWEALTPEQQTAETEERAAAEAERERQEKEWAAESRRSQVAQLTRFCANRRIALPDPLPEKISQWIQNTAESSRRA